MHGFLACQFSEVSAPAPGYILVAGEYSIDIYFGALGESTGWGFMKKNDLLRR